MHSPQLQPHPMMATTTTHGEAAMTELHCPQEHHAHYDYSYQLPMPPRITVPPPTISADMPRLHLGHLGEDQDMAFLKEMDLTEIVEKNTLIDWSYVRRRQAQMILPWLFLGPMLAAKDKTFIQQEGITMVLAIRSQLNSLMGAMNTAAQLGIEAAAIEAPSYFDLTRQFTEATRLINHHITRVRQDTLHQLGQPILGKVLVFCESGNEKSASVVAAYLMETLNDLDHIKAIQVCQAQRFCVNFDDTIKNILRSYWDILSARRSVAASQAHASPNVVGIGAQVTLSLRPLPAATAKNKRTIEQTRDEEDTCMDGADEADALRFQDRGGNPFQNSWA